MNKYRVELLINNGNDQNIRLSDLKERELEQWKIDLETRALNEYHNRKVKILSKKFDSKKQNC